MGETMRYSEPSVHWRSCEQAVSKELVAVSGVDVVEAVRGFTTLL
jgi:hypothetical protein